MGKRLSANSRLYLIRGGALFIGSVLDNSPHKHHAIQLFFALEGHFTLTIGEESYNSRSFLIDSNVEHSLSGGNGVQLTLLIEPESLYGEALKGLLEGEKGFTQLSFPLCQTVINLAQAENFGIKLLIETVFTHLGLCLPQKANIEERVMKVLALIEESPDKRLTIEELSSSIYLSESRLQHIFKAQIGISIKRYLLWKRVLEGIKLIGRSRTPDLTTSAYEAGFADSAHMSRTFKEMFGITLSDIFKSSRSIQVVVEEN